jgi:diguanylate cyclase (GGDEF)-like protein
MPLGSNQLRPSQHSLENSERAIRIELFDFGPRQAIGSFGLAETAIDFESLPDVFLRLTEDGRLLEYKVQATSELYLSPQQWQGMSVRAFLPERVSLLFEEAIAQAIQTQTPVSLEYSLMLSRQKTFFEARLFPARSRQVLGMIRNISDRKQIETQLLYDALHDPLTGLPNRTLFMDRVDMAMCRSHRLAAHRYAVLFIDLDRFKLINDNLGHVVGDQLLMAIANVLRQCIRAGDTVARLGGDEFTILLDDIKALDEVKIVAARIQEKLKTPILIDENKILIGASVGIVLGSSLYTKAVDLLRDADIALYQAKESGKGCYAIFEPQA